MKGAIVISDRATLPKDAAQHLPGEGLTLTYFDGGDVQLMDPSGRLFTLYEWDPNMYVDLPDEPRALLDYLQNRAVGFKYEYLVDCRWEDLFCRLIQQLSNKIGAELWVWDNSDRLFRSGDLDETVVHL